MFKVVGRYGLYALLVAGATVLLIYFAGNQPGGLAFERYIPSHDVVTSEFSPVEILQNLLLVFCILLFGWIASRDRLRRPFALGFCSLFTIFLARELDYFMDFYGIANLWQVLCASLLAITLVYLGRHRHRFEQGLRRSWPSSGLAIIMVSFILLIPFAQLLGHNGLWKGILGDDYMRVIKVSVEEFVELGAYALLAIGSIEFLYSWARLPQTRNLHARVKSRRR